MPTAVVTGSNRGIGLELCRELKKRGYEVFAFCRRPTPSLKELGVIIIDKVDVTDTAAIDQAVKRLEGKSIDVLVNNAGIYLDDTLANMDWEHISRTFQINTLGPLKITNALLPQLSEGSKIAMISSRMGSIADNTTGSHYGYRMSKAALNIAGASLAKDLKPKKISVALIHPGFVSTDMTLHMGAIQPTEAANGICNRIDQMSMENTGSFWHQNGAILPW